MDITYCDMQEVLNSTVSCSGKLEHGTNLRRTYYYIQQHWQVTTTHIMKVRQNKYR